jgi:hypothetical protein
LGYVGGYRRMASLALYIDCILSSQKSPLSPTN